MIVSPQGWGLGTLAKAEDGESCQPRRLPLVWRASVQDMFNTIGDVGSNRLR